MATQSIGVRIGLEGAAEYLRDIKSVTQETKALKSELELASRLKNPFERSSTMKDVLTSEIGAQEEKIKLLREAYEKAADETGNFSEKTMKAKDALNKAEIALDSMQKQLKDLPNGLEMAGDDILKGSEKYTNAGNEFKQAARPFWGATGLVAAGLTAVAKTSMSFEQQMAAVKAVTNASDADMESLTKTARNLGATTKYTATEAGEAFEYLGRAGFDAQQTIAMADSVLALAAADAIDFGEAADVSANMMHIFGLATDDMAQTQKNAARVADTLAQASRSANTDVLTIAETAKYAAPSFAALGWTIEDMAYAIDLAADYGIKGSQAGTGLRQAFKNLEAPTDKILTAMEKYGITLDDGTGKAVSFSNFMDQIRGTFHDLEINVMDASGELKEGEAIMEEYGNSLPITQMEKLQAIADIFGTRAMPTVLAMIEAGSDKYTELGEKIYNAQGAAKEMQDTMIDTAQGDMTILISELQELALTFGELVLPVLRDALDVAKAFVTRLNEMDEGTRKMILKGALVVGAIAPVLSLVGGIFTGIGNIMSVGGHLLKGTGMVIKLITGGGGLLSSLTAAKGGMEAATGAAGLLSGAKGIGSIIATAGPYAAAAGLIIGAGVLVYKNWDEIKLAAKTLAEEVTYHAGRLKEKVSIAWDNLKNNIGKAWNGAVEKVKQGWIEIGQNMVANVAKALKWGQDFGDNLKKGIESKIDAIKGAAQKIGDKIKSFLGHSTPEEGPLKNDDVWGAHLVENIASAMTGEIGTLDTAAYSASNAIKNGILGGVNGTPEDVASALKRTASAITGVESQLVGAANSMAMKLQSAFSSMAQSAKRWGSDLTANMASGITSNMQRLTSAANAAAATVKDRLHFSTPDKGPLKDFGTYMPDMMKLMAKGIRGGIPKVADAVNSAAYAMLPPSAYVDLPETGNSYQTNMGGVQIVINQQPGQDANELAEVLEEKLVALEERRMYAYGMA